MKKLIGFIKKPFLNYLKWLCFEEIYFRDRLSEKQPLPDVGDIVQYNWIANVCIASAITSHRGNMLKVVAVYDWPSATTIDYQDLATGEMGSCDYYWVSQVEDWRVAK